jgi:nitroimidazol reductase NimA-like FMN-containing flavoprotein (pyridoxamine 5'-phosphate oxidase superfamily)
MTDLPPSPYMTLATADADGVPWASPVWFATEDGRNFYWVSDPNARHSRNIADRPEIAMVIFDSTVTPGEADAVYLAARAARVRTDGIEIFNRCGAAQGLEPWPAAKVTAPAKHRLYRATVTEAYRLGPHDERVPLG